MARQRQEEYDLVVERLNQVRNNYGFTTKPHYKLLIDWYDDMLDDLTD